MTNPRSQARLKNHLQGIKLPSQTPCMRLDCHYRSLYDAPILNPAWIAFAIFSVPVSGVAGPSGAGAPAGLGAAAGEGCVFGGSVFFGLKAPVFVPPHLGEPAVHGPLSPPLRTRNLLCMRKLYSKSPTVFEPISRDGMGVKLSGKPLELSSARGCVLPLRSRYRDKSTLDFRF